MDIFLTSFLRYSLRRSSRSIYVGKLLIGSCLNTFQVVLLLFCWFLCNKKIFTSFTEHCWEFSSAWPNCITLLTILRMYAPCHCTQCNSLGDLFLNIPTNLISQQTSFRWVESHIFIHFLFFCHSTRSLLNKKKNNASTMRIEVGWNWWKCRKILLTVIYEVSWERCKNNSLGQCTDSYSVDLLYFTVRQFLPTRSNSFENHENFPLENNFAYWRVEICLKMIRTVSLYKNHQNALRSDIIFNQLFPINCFQK